jgi:hypothetical protein
MPAVVEDEGDDHHHEVPHGHDEPAAPPPVPAAVAELSGWPLVQALPHSTTRYRIDARITPDGHLQLTVTLNAVLNDGSELPRYNQELRDYKAEALEFIRSHGGDPATVHIDFIPAEAASI